MRFCPKRLKFTIPHTTEKLTSWIGSRCAQSDNQLKKSQVIAKSSRWRGTWLNSFTNSNPVISVNWRVNREGSESLARLHFFHTVTLQKANPRFHYHPSDAFFLKFVFADVWFFALRGCLKLQRSCIAFFADLTLDKLKKFCLPISSSVLAAV